MSEQESYLSYFGLEEAPFALTPDPGFLFPTVNNQKAFRGLHESITRGEGFCVLAGEIGTGKTTLCRVLLNHLQPKVETAFIVNPFLSESELLRAILVDFGADQDQNFPSESGKNSIQPMMERFGEFLTEAHLQGKRCVVILDECHNLPISSFEQIRILGNLETNKDKLLQIVLVGQPELLDILSSPRVRQLHQRVSSWFSLDPLSQQEVEPYFQFRLAHAGLQKDLPIGRDAVQLAYRLTKGYPRLMNILFDRTLREVCRGREWAVTKEHVRDAGKEVPLQLGIPKAPAGGKRRWGKIVAAIVVVLLVVAVAWRWRPDGGSRRQPKPSQPVERTIAPPDDGGTTGPAQKPGPKPDTMADKKPTPVRPPDYWSVSIGRFDQYNKALKAVQALSLRLAGLGVEGTKSGYVVVLGGEYLAVVGRFSKREQAEDFSKKLNAEGTAAKVHDSVALDLDKAKKRHE